MVAKYDVVIVGAGILGISTAYYLKLAHPELSVLVVDKNQKGGQGNTSKSAALFRNVFSSPMNRLLSSASIKFYNHLQKEKGIDIGLRYTGYLWLCDAEMWRLFQVLRLQEQKYQGSKTVSEMMFDLNDVTKENLVDMFGAQLSGVDLNMGEEGTLRLPDIEHGILAPQCGTLTPGKLFDYYEKQFKELGGELLYLSKVEKILYDRYQRSDTDSNSDEKNNDGPPVKFGHEQPLEFHGLKTADGVIRGDKICLAAGTWMNGLTDPLGIDVHMKPKKRQLFNIAVRPEDAPRGFFSREERFPIFVLPPDGIYLKPLRLRGSFVVGWADNLGRQFGLEDEPMSDTDFFEEYIRPVITIYLPWLANAELKHSWAGQYHYNTTDGNPYIFSINNMTVVTGASGSGIMKADALGKITAAKIMDELKSEIMAGVEFPTESLGFSNRMVIKESLII